MWPTARGIVLGVCGTFGSWDLAREVDLEGPSFDVDSSAFLPAPSLLLVHRVGSKHPSNPATAVTAVLAHYGFRATVDCTLKP